MKKSIISIIAMSILSSTAMAVEYKTVNTNQTAIFKSDHLLSKDDAMMVGSDYIKELQESNTFELSQKLPTPHLRMDKRSVLLTSTELNIKEIQKDDGNTAFYAEIEIDYSYSYRAKK